jgi:hypothetical protein
MKKLLFLVAFFLANSAFALDSDYIRVTGQGNSVDSAKENAFRKAIEIKVGSVIVSERIAINDKLLSDQIDSYSAGYIADYRLVTMTNNGSVVVATYDVKVESSKLVNQKLNTGRSDKAINGDSASAAYNSYIDQKNKGYVILDNVLAGYPKNAIIMKQRSYTLGVDSMRNAVIEVAYSIRWNTYYLEALHEAMSLIDEKGGYFEPGSINIGLTYSHPGNIFGTTAKHKFNDINVLNKVVGSVTGPRELRVMLVLRDNSYNVLYKGCVTPDMITGRRPALYNLGVRSGINFIGDSYEDSIFKLPIPEHYARTLIPKLSNVELQVAPAQDCQN